MRQQAFCAPRALQPSLAISHLFLGLMVWLALWSALERKLRHGILAVRPGRYLPGVAGISREMGLILRKLY
jgi:fumarate reductase subunit D